MTENKGDYHIMRQTLDGLLGNSSANEMDKPPAIVITINGGTVVIGDANHTNAKPDPALITEPQSRWLKGLVRKIGNAQRLMQPAYSDARTWTKLNAQFGVDHHYEIHRHDFDQAKDFLTNWLDTLDDP